MPTFAAEDDANSLHERPSAEGQAGYGIASDDPLLKLERYSHIVILPPRRFLDMMVQELAL